MRFDKNDLLPSDYSVVVWAEKMAVEMSSEGTDVNQSFPIFELDESIKQYGWTLEITDEDSPDKVDNTGEDEKNQDYEFVPTNIIASGDKLEHSF